MKVPIDLPESIVEEVARKEQQYAIERLKFSIRIGMDYLDYDNAKQAVEYIQNKIKQCSKCKGEGLIRE